MEDKDELIAKLVTECDSLKKELEKSMQERDVLLCEVNRLKFEVQMSDLKRLKEEETSEARLAELDNSFHGALGYGKLRELLGFHLPP
ncbi:hypothetical protein Pmani_016915 [Petrolisthes manimaculis]|uniref:Uncharacterized protein n=1 Tax=Petrolisthes manimaculis TaxID=1843537 RepID=A0AAE1PR90_9EUCA|nr:hypothetical protein Pmani_016915 [Petrolisthes manimaculis]